MLHRSDLAEPEHRSWLTWQAQVLVHWAQLLANNPVLLVRSSARQLRARILEHMDVASRCRWCGATLDSSFSWTVSHDAVTGEEFVLTACCEEHLQALQGGIRPAQGAGTEPRSTP